MPSAILDDGLPFVGIVFLAYPPRVLVGIRLVVEWVVFVLRWMPFRDKIWM
jgi:hypothetical protein